MAKYLIVGNYTADGMKGVLKAGGTARREAVEKTVADVGGTVESFYFAFGGDDVFVTTDLPDNQAAAALAMAVGAAGLVNLKTIVLLTPEEIDRAAAVTINYRPPGN